MTVSKVVGLVRHVYAHQWHTLVFECVGSFDCLFIHSSARSPCLCWRMRTRTNKKQRTRARMRVEYGQRNDYYTGDMRWQRDGRPQKQLFPFQPQTKRTHRSGKRHNTTSARLSAQNHVCACVHVCLTHNLSRSLSLALRLCLYLRMHLTKENSLSPAAAGARVSAISFYSGFVSERRAFYKYQFFLPPANYHKLCVTFYLLTFVILLLLLLLQLLQPNINTILKRLKHQFS